jgi:hypothetical protein
VIIFPNNLEKIMKNLIDIKGQRFGRLVAIKRIQTSPQKWQFRCDCGAIKEVFLNNVRHGHTRSCGCARASNGKPSRTATYRAWKKIFEFEVCKRWRKYDNFLADMGIRPEGQYLNRKNLQKSFCKSNCFWSNQAQYYTKNIYVINGEHFFSAIKAGEKYNVTDQTIHNWCKGYTKDGYYYPAKENCSILKKV